jgi:hypothetical protein
MARQSITVVAEFRIRHGALAPTIVVVPGVIEDAAAVGVQVLPSVQFVPLTVVAWFASMAFVTPLVLSVSAPTAMSKTEVVNPILVSVAAP